MIYYRKKKKSKSKKKDLEEAIEATTSESSSLSSTHRDTPDEKFFKRPDLQKTKAELAFLKKKEERDVKRIREKASVSHKERVEKFNEYLNSLSEHYEPAKVSWTK